MATNPNLEGEATSSYLVRLLQPLGLRVTRIAHGLPIGSDVEYADERTLSQALQHRVSLADPSLPDSGGGDPDAGDLAGGGPDGVAASDAASPDTH